MIILFDDDSVWNENAMRYYKNLYKDIVPVNCDGNGFSIINTISIYELYTNDNLQYLKNGRVYFLQTIIPKEYKVDLFEEERAVISNYGETKGYIYFSRPYTERYVDRIEWVDETQKVYKRDYYSEHSYRFKSEYIFDNRIEEVWFNEFQEEKVSIDVKTGYIRTFEDGIINGCYESKDLLERDCYFKILESQEKIVVTTKRQLSLIESLYQKKANICDLVEYVDVKQLTPKICLRDRKKALILTSTDNVYEVERLIKDFENIEFSVAANTAMSAKLMDLVRYKNVKLYPGIDCKLAVQLLNESSFYLDIHGGNQIYSAVERAYIYNSVILGYKDTVHSKEGILSDCIVVEKDYDSFSMLLSRMINDINFYEECCRRQSVLLFDKEKE